MISASAVSTNKASVFSINPPYPRKKSSLKTCCAAGFGRQKGFQAACILRML
jgi:hypothetical protein